MDTTQSPSGNRTREFPEHDYPHQELSGKIIAASHTVFRGFRFGFLESVYRRSLAVELEYLGVSVEQEKTYELFHRGVSVGVYRADLVAAATIIVETKTGAALDPTAPAQLLNCMSAAGLTLGLLVYFGPSGARVKRIIRSDEGRVTYV